MSKLIAIRSKIIVRKINEEKKSKTGLVISTGNEEHQPRPTKGEVLYVGTGTLKDDGTIVPMVVMEGDIVFFTAFASHPIRLEDEELLAIDERDVLAVLRG